MVEFKEPFTRLLTQGMVCKETVKCREHGFLFPNQVTEKDGEYRCPDCGRPVEIGRIEKMSKSKKNVVDPNVLIDQYGADTLRLFCLFAAPPERDLDWSDAGVEGAWRFLNRVWRLVEETAEDLRGVGPCEDEKGLEGAAKGLYRKTHQTIKRVTTDIETRFHFNTAISAVMELVNALQAEKEGLLATPQGVPVVRLAVETIVVLLSPVVPHLADELWQRLGCEGSVLETAWPTYREGALKEDEILIVIQVNGKVRSKTHVAAGTADETVKALAMADERVAARIGDRPVKKVIVVKNKLVNIVV